MFAFGVGTPDRSSIITEEIRYYRHSRLNYSAILRAARVTYPVCRCRRSLKIPRDRLKYRRGRGDGVLFQRFAREGEIPGHDPGGIGVCSGAAPRRRCVQRAGKGVHGTNTRARAPLT